MPCSARKTARSPSNESKHPTAVRPLFYHVENYLIIHLYFNIVFLVPPSSSDVFQIAAKTSHYFEVHTVNGLLHIWLHILVSLS